MGKLDLKEQAYDNFAIAAIKFVVVFLLHMDQELFCTAVLRLKLRDCRYLGKHDASFDLEAAQVEQALVSYQEVALLPHAQSVLLAHLTREEDLLVWQQLAGNLVTGSEGEVVVCGDQIVLLH